MFRSVLGKSGCLLAVSPDPVTAQDTKTLLFIIYISIIVYNDVKMEITELQKNLAATFRWTARLNMNEAVANHFSACVPGSTNFYVNKAGIHFQSNKSK